MARIHHDNAMRHTCSKRDVVGGEDHASTARRVAAYDIGNSERLRWIETSGRLIEQEQRCVLSESARKVGAGFLAA